MARYANRGEATGLYAGGTVSTSATYSLTGTAVTGVATTSTYNTVPLSDIGFGSGVSEIWARFDIYASFRSILAAQWDGKTNQGVGVYRYQYGGLVIYYYNSSGIRTSANWLYSVPTNQIATISFHIAPTVVEVWVNGSKLATYTGAAAGTEITSFRIAAPQNNYISNIIVADYDCTNETLAGWTGTLQADTARLLGNAVTISADTLRTLTAGQEVTLHGDTLRAIANGITIHGDTERTLTQRQEVTISADTSRLLGVSVALKADTTRNVINRVTIHADAVRNIPRVIENYTGSGIQSVSLTLAEKTLSDIFRMVTANPFSLQDTVQGRLLDFPYTFRVESTSQRDLLQTIQGMYDVDALMYNALKYEVSDLEKREYRARITTEELIRSKGIKEGIPASVIARKCANGISKNAVVNFDDFFPTSAQADAMTNYQSVLGGIFSWTSTVPRRQINIFIRQGNIHFLQRGKESGTINLDEYKHTRPNVERSLVRTMAARDINPYDSKYGSEAQSYGTWYWQFIEGNKPTPPGAQPPQVEYGADGLVSETVERIETDEGVTEVETHYTYESNGRSKFLVYEEITTRQGSGGADMEVVEKKKVRHWPLDNGQRYSSANNEDGAAMAGASTYPYSDHIEKKTNDMLIGQYTPGKWVTVFEDSLVSSQSIPVDDQATLTAVYNELKWMNRRTQEAVSLDVIGNVVDGVSEITHVFDFDTRYTLGGNEYYLVSNTVTLNPMQLIQTLNLVRWY